MEHLPLTQRRTLRFLAKPRAGIIAHLVVTQYKHQVRMKADFNSRPWLAIIAAAVLSVVPGFAQDSAQTNSPPPAISTNSPAANAQLWNCHMQATYVGDWHPGFPAQYSGPESLDNHSQTAETFSAD